MTLTTVWVWCRWGERQVWDMSTRSNKTYSMSCIPCKSWGFSVVRKAKSKHDDLFKWLLIKTFKVEVSKAGISWLFFNQPLIGCVYESQRQWKSTSLSSLPDVVQSAIEMFIEYRLRSKHGEEPLVKYWIVKLFRCQLRSPKLFLSIVLASFFSE